MCVCVCFTKKLILHCVFDKACICEPLENYLVYFARSCQISSSELWCHEVDAEKEFERMGQSMALPVSFTEELDFCDVLPVYQRDRLGVYREQFQEHVAQARCLPSDHAVYDLERGSARPAQVYGGAPLFTLVSHGTLWHDTHTCVHSQLLNGAWHMALLPTQLSVDQVWNKWRTTCHCSRATSCLDVR